MPRIAGLTFVLIGAAAVVACGGGGERQTMIDTQVDGCVRTASEAAPPGVDVRRVCTCAVGRVADGKSDDELRQIFAKAPSASDMDKMRACATEEMGKAGAVKQAGSK